MTGKLRKTNQPEYDDDCIVHRPRFPGRLSIVSPVPSSVMVSSVPLDTSTVKVLCVAAPACLGTKVTVMVQVAEAARVAPQSFDCVKAEAEPPEMEMLEMVHSASLPLERKISIIASRPGRVDGKT